MIGWRSRTVGWGCTVLFLLGLAVIVVVWPKFRQWTVQQKQLRVRSDLRYWSRAVEDYRHDYGVLPAGSGPVDQVLYPILVPKYVKSPFRYDLWGEAIEYVRSADGQHFRVISRGWRGVPDFPLGWVRVKPSTTSCYEDDMILQDGELLRYPAGPQRSCTLGWWSRFWVIPQPRSAARRELATHH